MQNNLSLSDLFADVATQTDAFYFFSKSNEGHKDLGPFGVKIKTPNGRSSPFKTGRRFFSKFGRKTVFVVEVSIGSTWVSRPPTPKSWTIARGTVTVPASHVRCLNFRIV